MERKTTPESIVRESRRKTRRKYSAEEKIRIVLEGFRGEEADKDIIDSSKDYRDPIKTKSKKPALKLIY